MLDAYIIDRLKRDQEQEDKRVPLYAPVPEPQSDSREPPPSGEKGRRGSCEISFTL